MNAEHASAPTKPPIWNDPAYRAIFFQAIALGLVVWFGLTIYNNTSTNLERQGIASGFDFLNSTAGFGIITHLIPYSEESSYGRAFLVGLLNTLSLALIGCIVASILGLIIGIARLSSNWLVAKLATVYIETFRNIPLLLQIFFWYFAVLRSLPSPRDSLSLLDHFFINNRGLYLPAPLPQPGFAVVCYSLAFAFILMIIFRRWAKARQQRTGQTLPSTGISIAIVVGLPALVALIMGLPLQWELPVLSGFNFKGGLVLTPEFMALLIALSIYTAAFIAEIVRSGIQAVSHGQTEAAYSLGLRPGMTMRLVILPQALRVIIPPLTSQYLNLTKNSSLAAAIAFPDLVSVFAGIVLNQTGQAVEVICITMAVYLSISLAISLFMNWYNAKMTLVER